MIDKLTSIPLDVSTRWNSTARMVRGFVAVEPVVHVAYNEDVFKASDGEEKIEVPDETDVLVLKGLLRLLECVERMSVYVQGADYMVLPYVHRVVRELMGALRRVDVPRVDPLPVFKKTLIESIESRFAQFDDPVHPCRLAALLCPVNCAFYYNDEAFKADNKAALDRIAEWLVYLANSRADPGPVVAAPVPNVVSSLFEDESPAVAAARRKHEEAAAKATAVSDLRGLVTQLVTFANENKEACVFDISRPHKMDEVTRNFYQTLCSSAAPKDKRMMQCVSLILSGAAASASAERAFSATGLLDSALRSRTSAETLEAMAVVKIFLRRASAGTIESFFQYAERCFHSLESCRRLKDIVLAQCVGD